MEPPARIYLCACCRVSVLICSHCDRGNRYCGDDCAQQMRKASQLGAAKRHQTSHRGRSAHAIRQRNYRERQRGHRRWHLAKKVTHQGSPLLPPAALLPPETATLQTIESESLQASKPLWQCHFCHCECSELVRIGFLRCRVRRPIELTHQKETRHAREP
jgi:hypothetical protein